jgi:hypothetical protein
MESQAKTRPDNSKKKKIDSRLSGKQQDLEVSTSNVTEKSLEDIPSNSEGSTTPVIRRKHRLDGEKICKVCGDKAVAFNFDVISCESCKTFFRRNAHKTQVSLVAFFFFFLYLFYFSLLYVLCFIFTVNYFSDQ